ncbi:MAG: hypothetical protein DRJ10_20505 [Bacteroidetes bacterium]|nr:MAG: hypothetical protein DRJ10_20505 [Bacteroidota bacterium]
MDDIEKIKKIQVEFVELALSHFKDLKDYYINSNLSKPKFYATKGLYYGESSISIVSGHGNISSLQYSLLNYYNDIKTFWDNNALELSNCLKKLNYNTIGGQIMQEQDLVKYLLLFDAVMIPLAIYNNDPKTHVLKNTTMAKQQMIVHQLTIFELAEAIRSDLDMPLVIFYPEIFIPNEQDLQEYEQSALKVALNETLRFFSEGFNLETADKTFNDINDLDIFFEMLDKAGADYLNKNLNIDILTKYTPGILEYGGTEPISYSKGFTMDIKERMFERKATLEDFKKIAITSIGSLQGLLVKTKTTHEFNFDIVYSKFEQNSLNLFMDGLKKHLMQAKAINENELYNYSFKHGFKWLEGLSILDCVKLRESSILEETRAILRTSKYEVKTASISGFEKAMKDYEQRVVDTLSTVKDQYLSDIKKKRKRATFSKVSFGLTCTFTGVSFAVPILSPIAIGLAVFSLAYGGNSLRDVINSHLSGKKGKEEFFDRPLASLIDLM